MDWTGLLGIALLLYVPAAYLLLRAGYRRRTWAGSLGMLLFALLPDVDLYVEGLAAVGVTHALWTAGLTCFLLALVAAGFRPLVRGERYTATVTGFQVTVLGLLSHLLAGFAPPVRGRAVYPAFDGETASLVAASEGDVNAVLLAVGLVTFLLALGYARIHGPIGRAAGRPRDGPGATGFATSGDGARRACDGGGGRRRPAGPRGRPGRVRPGVTDHRGEPRGADAGGGGSRRERRQAVDDRPDAGPAAGRVVGRPAASDRARLARNDRVPE